MLAWGMTLMLEYMPVEARCQEDHGINALYRFLSPEQQFSYSWNDGFNRIGGVISLETPKNCKQMYG
jgi:hypothetical protein